MPEEAMKNPPPAIGLSFAKTPPSAVDAGTAIVFAVAASFPEGVPVASAVYRLEDRSNFIEQGELPTPKEGGAIPFSLPAPDTAGEHRWVLTVASAPDAKGVWSQGALSFAFATVPHATSLAVWDTPSPAIRGKSFTIKVAAKCTSACLLAGETVEVCDEAGNLVASAPLGDAAWQETAGLYWADVTLKAPRTLKLHAWTVKFPCARRHLPHTEAQAKFTFMVAKEPAHAVSVTVIDKSTKAPVAGAQIRLGLYRAVTGEKGSARLAVSKGEFPLVVTRAGYEIAERILTVGKDMRVKVMAEKMPEEDPYAAWTA